MIMLDWARDTRSDKYYIFVEEIGRGSYGKCYLAVDETNNYLACKTCDNTSCFADEIKLHSELKHENVVRFLNGFRFDEMNYLILELCDLGTVNDLLKCRKLLTDPEVKCITKQISNGLIYLHDNLIIHRDLKLTNLLISSKMVIKISDFGLSKRLETMGEKRNTVCGTNIYMAPEVKRKEGYHFGVDIWSLGCIVYTLLDGKEPMFSKETNGKNKNIVKLPLVSMTNISQLAWKFLKTIFVHSSKRPCAKTVCLHPYFSTFLTLTTLELACFYKKPLMQTIVSHNIKKKVLRDCTNIHHKPAAEICNLKPIQGKENDREQEKDIFPKMQLRSRKRLIKSILPSLREAINGRGSIIAKNLLDNLLLLLEIESSDWKLEKSDVRFACVRRWVAGLASFGYETSDGGIGVVFKSVHIHQSKYGTEFYQVENAKVSIKETIYSEAVNYVKRSLEMLTPSGPTYPYQTPILVLAQKFFKVDNALISNPTVAFLLSNGTCQVNYASHEKLIMNCYEDIFVWWDLEEIHCCNLYDLTYRGLPFYLKDKIAVMCYFLATVANI